MSEDYYLGIDIGATRVTAASARPTPDGSVAVSHLALGHRSDHAPAVVFVTENGGFLFGDTAERRGVAEPEHLLREFTRNVGNDVPLSVGGHRVDAPRLLAQTVASVVANATEAEGAEPAGITVTYPSSWGPHRTSLVRTALADVGLPDATLMSEAEAAARNYEATHPLEPGQSVAIYDLGGTSFHTSVIRKEWDGSLTRVGQPANLDNLGGADFDDIVLRHVLRSAGADNLDMSDAATLDALTQLRRECVDAKEVLSFDTEVTIPVHLPGVSTKIRLTRSEFEAMIEEHLDRTVATLDDAVEAAGVDMSSVAAIVMVGGSSRIPRVAQKLSELFGRPIVVDQDPKSSTALGAARGSLYSHVALTHPGAEADTPGEAVLNEEADDDEVTAVVPVPVAATGSAVPRARWWAGLALAAVAVAGIVMIATNLLSEFTANDDEASPQHFSSLPPSIIPTETTLGPESPVSESGATPEPVDTPDEQPQQEQQQPVQQDPAQPAGQVTVREIETIERYITTRAHSTVTATATATTTKTTTQRPSTTPSTTKPTTPKPTTPKPTTPAPTTQPPTTRPPTTTPPTTQPPTTQPPTSPPPTTQDPTTPPPTTSEPEPTTQAPEPPTEPTETVTPSSLPDTSGSPESETAL